MNKLIRFSSQFSSKKAGKPKIPDKRVIKPTINDSVPNNSRLVKISARYNKLKQISIIKNNELKLNIPPIKSWIRYFFVLPLDLIISLIWKVAINNKFKDISKIFKKEKNNVFEGINIIKTIGIKFKIIKTFKTFKFIIFEYSFVVIKYKKVIIERNNKT